MFQSQRLKGNGFLCFFQISEDSTMQLPKVRVKSTQRMDSQIYRKSFATNAMKRSCFLPSISLKGPLSAGNFFKTESLSKYR